MIIPSLYKIKPPVSARPASGHSLAEGLVGCWLINERAGGKIFDLSGNGNTGVLVNDTHFVPGKFGWALDFDGTEDYVDIAEKSDLDNADMTVSFWTKPHSLSQTGVLFMNRESWNTNYGFEIFISNDGLSIRGSGSPMTTDGDFFTGLLNAWIHIVVVYKGADVKAYRNGREVHSGTVNPIIDSTHNLIIGGFGSGPYTNYDGEIDHAMIWRRALWAGEIARLYREPFAIFAKRARVELTYGLVSLAGSTGGQSAISGALSRTVRLSGSIKSTAGLYASLTVSPKFRKLLEKEWLRDALFAGMTANAFKLGTVLTLGWFWVRFAGCSALYRGSGMGQIDFANILAVAGQEADTITVPIYVEHNSSSTYFYVIRRFNKCGYQELTLGAAVKVAIDADSNLAEPQPNKIFASRTKQVNGSRIQLVWFYCPVEQKAEPACFKVYYDNGTGQIDYENPIATIDYQGRRFYSYESSTLDASRYLFAIRARDAEGVENSSLAKLRIQLQAAGVNAVEILNAQTI